MKAAVDGGAEVVVCAGYLQEAALRRAAVEFPDVPFVFIDGYPIQEQATEYDADGNACPTRAPSWPTWPASPLWKSRPVTWPATPL